MQLLVPHSIIKLTSVFFQFHNHLLATVQRNTRVSPLAVSHNLLLGGLCMWNYQIATINRLQMCAGSR